VKRLPAAVIGGEGPALIERRALLISLDLTPPADALAGLASRLGEQRSRELQHSFIRAATHRALQARPLLAPVGLACPAEALDEIRMLVDDRLPLWAATGGGEGERLAAALERAFRGGATAVVTLRPGFPDLPLSFVLSAARLLEKYDLVIGPTGGGGFFLLGLRVPVPDLFSGLDRDADRALHTVLRQAGKAGLSQAWVPSWQGVRDTPDLLRLHDRLQHASGEPSLAAAVGEAVAGITPGREHGA